MIAYVILSHQEFDCVPELLKIIYTEENLYCIAVNQTAIGQALSELHYLRSLPNVHLIVTPPTSWAGSIAEAYLHGIEFCLKVEAAWDSLIILTNTDVALVSQADLAERLLGIYKDKIVLDVHPQLVELEADRIVQRRLLEDPFKQGGDGRFDSAYYNPFTHTVLRTAREGVNYYVRPDAVLPAWTKDSHFLIHLSRQVNSWANGEVFLESFSPFSRRALAHYFTAHVPAFGSLWGVLPRDFCEYCVSDGNVMMYFAMVKDAFSIEESFFATLAHHPQFVGRILHENMMFKMPMVDGRMAVSDVAPERVGRHLFARKVPNNETKADIYRYIHETYGIQRSPAVSEKQRRRATETKEALVDALRRHVDLAGASLSFGVFGESYFYDVRFGTDGLLAYDPSPRQAGDIGSRWLWRPTGLEIVDAAEGSYAFFDSFRVHGDRLLLLGRWWHHSSVPLAFVSPLAPLMRSTPLRDLVQTDAGEATSLTEHIWSCWFSGREFPPVLFKADGTLRLSDASEPLAGYWRTEEGRVLTFGLDDLPVAVFDQVSVSNGRWQVAGVTWGRTAEVEPCFLRTA